MIEMEEEGVDAKFKQMFEYIQHGKYLVLIGYTLFIHLYTI